MRSHLTNSTITPAVPNLCSSSCPFLWWLFTFPHLQRLSNFLFCAEHFPESSGVLMSSNVHNWREVSASVPSLKEIYGDWRKECLSLDDMISLKNFQIIKGKSHPTPIHSRQGTVVQGGQNLGCFNKNCKSQSFAFSEPSLYESEENMGCRTTWLLMTNTFTIIADSSSVNLWGTWQWYLCRLWWLSYATRGWVDLMEHPLPYRNKKTKVK